MKVFTYFAQMLDNWYSLEPSHCSFEVIESILMKINDLRFKQKKNKKKKEMNICPCRPHFAYSKLYTRGGGLLACSHGMDSNCQ